MTKLNLAVRGERSFDPSPGFALTSLLLGGCVPAWQVAHTPRQRPRHQSLPRLLLGAASPVKAQTVKALGQGGQNIQRQLLGAVFTGRLQPVHFVASIMQPASLSQISEPVHGGSGETSPREGHLGRLN